MSVDLFSEFKKTIPDCSIACYISYLQNNMPRFPTTHQERSIAFMQKSIFWKLIEAEFFNSVQKAKNRRILQQIIEETLIETLFFHDLISKTKFANRNFYYILKSECLSLIGQLNFCLNNLKNHFRNDFYQLDPHSQSLLEKGESQMNKYRKLVNSKKQIKEKPDFSSKTKHLQFFLDFNNDFCQICSITDTLNEEDFFIFCEVF